jgi:serine/threonine protein kinase
MGPPSRLVLQKYSKAIDVWAVGCIFGEMMRRKAMFPGADYMEQLKLIVECMGSWQWLFCMRLLALLWDACFCLGWLRHTK